MALGHRMTLERQTMAKDTTAVWSEIDVTTLNAEMQKAYEVYKDAQRKAAELRVAFEQMVNEAAELPQGQKLVFGYRFGKLSAAVVKDDAKPKAASPAKLSLADYLKGQQAAGKAV